MSDENKKYVPEGVFLVCDKGEIVTQLIANPERNVTIYGAKKCTEADNKFEQNILPFGKCKTCGTCKFAEIEWTKTKQGVRVNGTYALLENSEGICKEGQGIIKIYFDEYLASLANENQNESAFVKESISSEILGTVLTSPFGKVIDLFCEDDNKFTEGVGRGFKKGMEGTWNFLTSDMWKADTWKGMGKLAVISVAYSSPATGMLMGDTALQSLDNVFGTDFKQTKDGLVDGVKKTAGNAWEDVKRGNMGEVGESYGQLQYAVVEALAGTKGAGLALKGATTGAKALIGAERLAQVAATASNWMSKLKAGALGLVKVGRKIVNEFDSLAKMRVKLGLPKAGSLLDDATVAKIKINGKEYYGVNSKYQNPKIKSTLKVNAQTKTHAEANAVQNAINDGMKGSSKKAEMWVDRDLCDACGKYNGVGSLARELGVEEIIVHSPSGTYTFKPPIKK